MRRVYEETTDVMDLRGTLASTVYIGSEVEGGLESDSGNGTKSCL